MGSSEGLSRAEGSASDEAPGGGSRSKAEASSDHQHWFEELADHMGPAYLRYSFTKGTTQEVEFLVTELGLTPGMRLLDVGCGPGRHALALAERGITVHGIDISQTFVDLATADAAAAGTGLATFERRDARDLGGIGGFDVVICLCQGAFGLMTVNGDDLVVLRGMAEALREGGRLALSAFSSYFAVRYHVNAEFDADSGVSHEFTEIRSQTGAVREVSLWTGCYTPRELRLLAAAVGMQVDRISSVEPGAYGNEPHTTESPEFLVLATRTNSPRVR